MNNFLTVYKKEILDMWRDKKTILFTIFLPVLLYPLMFTLMSKATQSMIDTAESGINISISGDTNSKLATMIKNQPNIKMPEITDTKSALKNGTISLIINIPNNFDEDVLAGKQPVVEMLIDESSNNSQIASNMVQMLYEQYKNNLIENKLIAAGLDSNILEPFKIESKSGISDDGSVDMSLSMVSGYIPMMLILLMLVSATGIASDLGAGEKEKLTLEPLLSTSCSRNSLLWGKITALCTISIIGLIANLGALVFALNSFKVDGQAAMSVSLSPTTIVGIFFISLILQITISSLQIAVSIYARSSKEANTYLGGLMMPGMLACMIPLMMDVKNISVMMFNIPITNVVCLMKEFIAGIVNPGHIAITCIWLVIYVIVSVLFAKFMFSREEVVFRS